MQFFVYILYSKKINKFHIGSTDDVKRSLAEQNKGKDSLSRNGFPWEVVYTETFDSRSAAFTRERFIKSQKSTNYLKLLIEKYKGTVSEKSYSYI